MSRIYSSTNRIKFTDIPEKYAIPRAYKGKQGELHSAVITYVYGHFHNTHKYKQKVVDALNGLTYSLMESNIPPYKWHSADPIETMPDDMDMDLIEKELGDLFLTEESIEWDVSPTYDEDDSEIQPKVSQKVEVNQEAQVKPAPQDVVKQSTSKVQATKPKIVNKPFKEVKSTTPVTAPTPKEDLYIQSPKYPRFDVNKVWISAVDGSDKLVIYTTLPEIPTRQNEISVTTKLESMTVAELMRLYPNHLIHTRSPKMYEKYEGLDYDEELGTIFPIEGFTRSQVLDNIICYPHLYKLKKIDGNGNLQNFYSTIEINGELKPVGEVWDSLPESKVIPRDSEFVKEYVVRRYLLEESVGIEHKYKMFGTLHPFLTLFMPPSGYIDRGYKDVTEIVKKCVSSRVSYKQSRNPVLRRLNNNV